MARMQATPLNFETLLTQLGKGRTSLVSPKKQTIYLQGDAADTAFYLQAGKVKLTVVSQWGKEAVIAILEGGAFFGESCLAGQGVRTETVTAVEDSSLVRIDKEAMSRLLYDEPGFAEFFMTYLLTHTIRLQEDFVDQLFNSSEKRLARALLLMAHFGEEGKPESVIPKFSQEMLAEMIGTTRSRVSFFMNKFRKLGFIEYTGKADTHAGLYVRSSLLKVILGDEVSYPFPLLRSKAAEPGSVQWGHPLFRQHGRAMPGPAVPLLTRAKIPAVTRRSSRMRLKNSDQASL